MLTQFKVDQKVLGWVWSEMGEASGHRTLKLTVSQELVNGIN